VRELGVLGVSEEVECPHRSPQPTRNPLLAYLVPTATLDTQTHHTLRPRLRSTSSLTCKSFPNFILDPMLLLPN